MLRDDKYPTSAQSTHIKNHDNIVPMKKIVAINKSMVRTPIAENIQLAALNLLSKSQDILREATDQVRAKDSVKTVVVDTLQRMSHISSKETISHMADTLCNVLSQSAVSQASISATADPNLCLIVEAIKTILAIPEVTQPIQSPTHHKESTQDTRSRPAATYPKAHPKTSSVQKHPSNESLSKYNENSLLITDDFEVKLPGSAWVDRSDDEEKLASHLTRIIHQTDK